MEKIKERILEATREKQRVSYKGTPLGYQLIFCRNFAGQKGVAWYIQSREKEKEKPAS